VARGLRSSPGRRVRPGAGSAVDEEPADDDEEADTSVSDLTTEADPATFDRTFTDTDADLSIEGEFEPVAGPKQVIPRVAYVLNYNLLYNENRDRWEPQKKAPTRPVGSRGNITPEVRLTVNPVHLSPTVDTAVTLTV